MSFKIIPPKLAKKDLLALYDITHPTLRSWFRRAGLAEFIGRRKFLAHELVLIFQAIGRPRLARQAAQRLKNVYARLRGVLPDEVRFKEKYQRTLPPQRQDCLEDSVDEVDYPQIQPLEHKSPKDPLHLNDAIARLRITAVLLLGQKAIKKQLTAHQSSVVNAIVTQRKKLHKRRRSLLIR